jgi:hypothetical protein
MGAHYSLLLNNYTLYQYCENISKYCPVLKSYEIRG